MKLKVLPPTLRIKNRYLALNIKSESPITRDEFVYIAWNACLRLHGEIYTSNFDLWLVKFYESSNNACYDKNNNNATNDSNSNVNDNNINSRDNANIINNIFYYHAVLRCKRGFEEEIRSSLALNSNYRADNGRLYRVNIVTLGISGTINALINKFFK
ncbi:MAG: Rpp14/Pop5 family protein [Methanobacteriaceae archaeon]